MTLTWTEPDGRTITDPDAIITRLWAIGIPIGARRDLAEVAIRTGDLDEANHWLAGAATITEES